MYKHYRYLNYEKRMTSSSSKYCGCLYYSVNALARIMSKMADEEFAMTGLSSSHAFLMMTVNEKPGIQPKKISCHMQLTPSTVTRLIEKMEYRGYVERKNVGRATEVYPTEEGKKIYPKIKEAWNNLYQKYNGILGKTEANKLIKEMNKASEKLS